MSGRRAQPRNRTSRASQRNWSLTVVLILGAAAGVTAVIGGTAGAGQPPTYQPAPVVSAPFNANDPDIYTGTTTTTPLPPDTLAIPALNITAPITHSAVDDQNRLMLPSSDKTGWYTGTAPVGSLRGSTVIAGHVNFPDGSPGALGRLAEITKGTPIQVTDGAGTVHTYKAVSAQTLIKTALPEELFTRAGKPQLVLITCGGNIEDTGNGVLGYAHNTVVTADLTD